MMAQPMKTLELHYPMIQFLIKTDSRKLMIVFNLFLTRERFLHFNMPYPGYSSIFTNNYSDFLKILILICCLNQGSFSPNNLMERVKERCEPCVVRARPSVPPQRLWTWISGFSHKATGAKSVDMATTQKLSICFSLNCDMHFCC